MNGLIDRVLTEQQKDSSVVYGHLSTMEKPKGVMNFLMTHLSRLTVTSLSKSQHLHL